MKIAINGRQIEVAGRKTVLEVAREHGIYIPSLCDHQRLAPFAGCRLCLIEIKGKKGFPPSCSTYVEDGLDILTETPQLQTLRRQVLELILSEHPNACLICTEKKNCEDYKSTIRKVGEVTGCVFCPNNSRCRLQEVVEASKIDRVSFPSSYRNFDVRRDDPFFDRDYNLCILCGRCVRMCNEVRGASAISFVFRGTQAVIGTAFDRPLLESGCQFCGACVDVCPTGALVERATRGESLPDEKRDTICPLCSIGCELTVELKKGRILSSIPKDGDTVNSGQACVKGRFILRDVVYSPKRILRPMVRRDGELQEASWDEALDFVAQKLKAPKGREVAFVASPQLALEDTYIFQKFARQILHTDISDGTLRLSPLAVYLEELQKHGLEPELNFEMSALANAKIILVADADVVTSQPLIWLEILKATRKGAKLVVVNSKESALRRHASFNFEIKPGTESYLFAYLSRQVIENGQQERFSPIDGYEDLKRSLEGLNSAVLPSAGIKEEDLRSVARLLSEGHPSVFLFGPAMIYEPQTGANIRALWNLALLSDARIIPLAGENNQRGVLEIWRRLPSRGLPISQILSEAAEGRIKALYLAGPFPVLSKATAEFLVVQDSYPNENMKLADAVFPAATFAETEGTYVNGGGRIQKVKRLIEPLGESKPDWWIICQVAQRMGAKNFSFKNASDIAHELGKAMPALEEASHCHHQKKGKSAFVLEEKKAAKRFLHVELEYRLPETSPEYPLLLVTDYSLDYYRSLNLSDEVKGLERLRERQRLRREE